MTGRTSPVAPWCTVTDLPESCNNVEVKPAVLEQAFSMSSSVLYNITKRRWPGVVTDTYRPCCECDSYAVCGCYPCRSLTLLGYPVIEVLYLKIDGTDAAATDYELRDESTLVPLRRLDGTVLLIPAWQDMTQPTTERNTHEVSYTWGAAPPPEGVTAAAVLGYEIALSWSPTTLSSCRLPKRVTSITRQGLTVAVIDPLSLFADGLVGIPEIDLWTKSLDFGDNNGAAELWDAMKMPRATRRT